jgi:hippurate hydrolase
VWLAWAAAPAGAQEPRAGDDAALLAWIDAHVDELLELYRDLHAHPELSGAEHRTAARAAAELRRAGLRVTAGVGGTGVVGVLRNGAGPTLLLRGDMDALPVAEETGAPYASRVVVQGPDGRPTPVMHACGHDLHITALVGTAALLAELRERWRGTLVAIAQPAEEIGRGARAMIGDGLFERFPRPDVALALHVWSDAAAGSVGITPGWWAANVDSVDITVFGRGGHGARPQEAVDPVVIAAHLVVALQTIVSRRNDPLDPAVVTVGAIRAGNKHNVIPDEAQLQLTVRSFDEPVRQRLLAAIREIAEGTCRTFGCTRAPQVDVKDEHTPAAFNDPSLSRGAAALLAQVLGSERVSEPPRMLGGEDFGLYGRTLGIPALLFRLGAADPATAPTPPPGLHSSRFLPAAEPALRTGLRALAHLALWQLAAPEAPAR